MRDYEQWHRAYDDPDSDLSWRLRTVQSYIAQFLDARSGPVRVVSCCSGDGRDLFGALAGRRDADRVRATLVEIHPGIAERARSTPTEAHVEVRTADAGTTDAYLGSVPADLVIMVGIFGNIDLDDVRATIGVAPAFCTPGATLLWSRGRSGGDENDPIREWFVAAGFHELVYATRERGSLPALGAVRYDGPPRRFEAGRRLFTFRR